MGLDKKLGKMAENIQANIKKAKRTDMDSTKTKMAVFTPDFGKMINKTDPALFLKATLTVSNKAFGKTENKFKN